MLRLVIILVLMLIASPCAARDRGQYAGSTPEMKEWFNGLASGKGPCCSDADGSALSDVDWESDGIHYRVRIAGKWVVVPDEAVLRGPNKAGRTMVWPMWKDGEPIVRCFIPGSMT